MHDKVLKYPIVSLVAATVALVGIVLLYESARRNDKSTQAATHDIILTDSGFIPSELVIIKGDTVVFTTIAGKPFWPASDLHPTHTIYSEFDPRHPLEPQTSWKFIFSKAGFWSFHDHLAPLHLGTIKVMDGSSRRDLNASADFEDPKKCPTLSNNAEKTNCWNKSLQYVLDTQGITAGYNIYAEFYKNEPVFARNCHDFTHKIGEAAYQRYSQNKDFDVTSQVAFCSYGFFHGFIEAMFQETGALEQARDFCDYIDKKLKGQTSPLSACMHGIGHGVTDGSDPRTWGNVQAMIQPGIDLCERVGRTEYEKHVCGTGVFNSLEGMYLDPKYKLVLDKRDPFWICRQQESDNFKSACFDDFKDVLMVITNDDFAKAAKFVEGIKEDNFAQGAIDNLATYNAYIILRRPSYNYAIDICHALQPRLHVACISGLGAGFMTAGEPDKEYIKAIELCKSPRITANERTGCFKRVLHASYIRYSPAVHQKVCAMVEKRDKGEINFCDE